MTLAVGSLLDRCAREDGSRVGSEADGVLQVLSQAGWGLIRWERPLPEDGRQSHVPLVLFMFSVWNTKRMLWFFF